MISKRWLSVTILATAIIYAAVFTVSCATSGVNANLIKYTTDEEKADIMFAKGKALYVDEIKAKNNLAVVDDARRFLNDALTFNALHPEAQDYLDLIDGYIKTRLTANKNSATKLFAKKPRTDAENYRLILAITEAAALDKNDKDVQKLQASTKDIRASVISSKQTALTALQKKIATEKSETQLAKELREADLLIRDLQKIDPSNGTAASARALISKTGDTLVQKDIDAANKALTAKKYADAETAILRAEKNLAAVSQDPGTTIPSIKYKVYYWWAVEQYNAKNYKVSSEKIAKAIKIWRSQESATLKAKIDKALSTKDYDADIKAIIASVDDSLSKGDPASAMRIIDETTPKLKAQANIDSLTAKQADVRAMIKTIYQDGIARYNDEDYEGARQKFSIVVDVDPEYEQAQAYLDRSDTKIRALTGKD